MGEFGIGAVVVIVDVGAAADDTAMFVEVDADAEDARGILWGGFSCRCDIWG